MTKQRHVMACDDGDETVDLHYGEWRITASKELLEAGRNYIDKLDETQRQQLMFRVVCSLHTTLPKLTRIRKDQKRSKQKMWDNFLADIVLWTIFKERAE